MSVNKRKKKALSIEDSHGSQAAAAYLEVRDDLATAKPDSRGVPNVDMQDAGTAAIGVLAGLKNEPTRARIAKLAQIGECKADVVECAETLAWAAIHVRRKLILASSTESEANVPTSITDRARALRAVMRKVADYQLIDDENPDPELVRVLDALRVDSGNLDLANDLEGYADVYEEHPEELARDGKRYDPKHVGQARKLAHEIYVALGLDSNNSSEDWLQLQSALWPRFVRAYEEAAAVGRFLHRDDGGEARYPTLVTAARTLSGTARSPKKGASEGEKKPEGGEGGGEKKPEGEAKK